VRYGGVRAAAGAGHRRGGSGPRRCAIALEEVGQAARPPAARVPITLALRRGTAPLVHALRARPAHPPARSARAGRPGAPEVDYQPPPARYTAALLCGAIDLAAAVRLVIDHDGQRVFGFGPQTDRRVIRHSSDLSSTGQALNSQAVANYIAKYATKSVSVQGLPSGRIRCEADIEQLRCSAHYRSMITAAWQLGNTRHDVRFRAWAHMLGYGGHFLTKSRRYSVTFGQLRAARADHRRATRAPEVGRDAWGRPLDETVVLVLGTIWSYAGVGHATPAAELAAASAARAREHHAGPIPVDDSVSTGS
jgi:hypothetical protein